MRFPQFATLATSLIVAMLLGPLLASADQKEDEQLCTELNSLMTILHKSGNYAAAADVGETLVMLVATTHGFDSVEYATCLDNLAFLYNYMGDYAKAEPLYRRLLEVTRQVWGEEHRYYAKGLCDLGGVYVSTGDYAKAERLYNEALEIHGKTLGRTHPAYAINLNSLGLLYRRTAEYVKAESRYRQALEIKGEATGKDASYAVSLHNLADLYHEIGRYVESEELYEEAREITRNALGKEHPDYATSLNGLAFLLHQKGAYIKAEQYYRQALEVRRQAFGRTHPKYANILINLAALHQDMREYAKAEALLEEALAVYRPANGDRQRGYIAALNNLASLYFAREKYSKAQHLLEGIRVNVLKTVGEEHPEYATALCNLAAIHEEMTEYDKAKALREQSRSILRSVLGERHVRYAQNLNNLGWLHLSIGEYTEAEATFQEAIRIFRETVGEAHLDCALSQENLGMVDVACERYHEALTRFDHGLTVRHAHATEVLVGLPERRQVEFIQHGWYFLERLLSFVHQFPSNDSAVSRATEWLARWKALAGEIQAERYRLLQLTNDRVLRGLAGQLAAVRAENAKLTLSPPVGMPPGEVEQRRRSSMERLVQLEAKLVQQSDEYSRVQRGGHVNLKMIADSLPVGSVLLDYARFHEFNFRTKDRRERWGGPRYVVFITSAGKVPNPLMVDLGRAKPIEDAVEAVRRAIEDVEKGRMPIDDVDIRKRLLALRKLVIDPVLPHITGKKHWVICPDGQLSLVPFEAFPLSTGQYLIESCRISYLGAGREAVVFAGPEKEVDRIGKPLLVGDPDFDLSMDGQLVELERLQLDATVPPMRGVEGAREVREQLFRRLPATGVEVELAVERIGGTTFLRRQALEGVVKRAIRPDVLYLATHGFVLPGHEWKRGKRELSTMTFATRGMGSNGVFPSPTFSPSTQPNEDPLLRCGLAFAGANFREKSADGIIVDDGILTGVEAAGLHLSGTRLVVLSACQTGLGDVQQGEGVMGLRRAFLLAGAQRVLSTLWMVPDEHSQQLMSNFITRWQSGMPAIAALREAQIAMITQLRNDRGHAHPIFWAAFTLTGDWR